MNGHGWWRGVCGRLQPRRPQLESYRCSRPRWHRGAHVAQLDGSVLAVWDR